ncbi:MAG: molybdopterin-binding protein, partial [Chloroflexi bacterium]|nr:molybdopterin-binding protein [Chloroflexota bacterium]
LGMRAKLNDSINRTHNFKGEFALKPDEKVTPEEIGNRALKHWFGEEHDWEWFKKHGWLGWPKKAEEAYWRYFVDARAPIYLEYMVDMREKSEQITKELGIDYDFSQFTPFISWTPSGIHADNPEHDLYCFSYRDILHSGTMTAEQPWIDEASHMNPYSYTITMNAEAARKKGLQDGDIIEIESAAGRTTKGRLHMMEGQHPQTIAIAACTGHWAKGLPIARGKGTNFEQLMEFDLQHIDPLTFGIETCVRVKVRKAADR